MPTINVTPLASTSPSDALALANTIMGSGVTVVSATLGGTAAQAGTFSGAIASSSPAWTVMDSGAIFSSGNITGINGANNSDSTTTYSSNTASSDPQFNTLINPAHSGTQVHFYDVSYIEITFIPTNAYLSLQYLFGSEEYNEYVNSSYSDAIGIWVNSSNIALTPEGKPISINTINQGTSSAPSLYVNNSIADHANNYTTQMDGFTRTLGASIAVNPGVNNTIRIAVADVGDDQYDSWLLVKANSVETITTAVTDTVVTPISTPVTIDVLANDHTVSGTALTTIAIADQTATVGNQITLASGGKVTLQADGKLLYEPVTGSAGNDLFTYTIADGAGNTSTGYVNVGIGISTIPSVTSQVTNDTTPVISGTVSTGAALVSGEVLKVTVNGATYTVVPDSSGHWSIDLGTAAPSGGMLTPLTNGTYDVTAVISNGTASAIDSTSGELIIDTVAPTAPTVISQTTSDTTPVITGSIGGATALLSGEVLKVTVSGATYTVTPDASGNWSLDLGSASPTGGTLTPLTDGTYSVTTTVTDAAGNVAADITSSELIINTAPTVTSPSVNEASPYAVFTVTGTIGQAINLALANGSATGTGMDYGSATASNLQYSLDNGTTWQDYSSAVTFSGSTILVRTPITNDTTYEGAETFTLTVTPSVGSAVVGTATIHDDGTGNIFNGNGTVNNSATPDNDTPLVTMGSVTVSEASPYAVVQVSLSHASTSAITFTPTLTSGTGTVGIDSGSNLEYFNGSAWVSAASGVSVAPGNTSVFLRTSIIADTIPEGAETITISTGAITGSGVSTSAASGVITITDDGSSANVFNADTNSPTPVVGVADDDRPLGVSSPSVNEASSYAVFTVTGTIGQAINLALVNGSATGAGTDYGSATASNLQYSLDNGTTWQDYSSAVTFTGSTILVRTPITNDTSYEGAETFTLTVTPTTGTTAVGTATIHDDGTGNIYNENGTVNNSATPDNDTPVVTMGSVTVSEASPYAVVQVSLSHASTSAVTFTPTLTSGTGTVGTDSGSNLEYFNGSAWVSAASGVTIPAGHSSVLLRTAIINDDIYEGLETINISTGGLAGAGVSSTAVSGVITIADDGSSANVFNADTNSAAPTVGLADNDLKSNDNDGIPQSTESGLAQQAGSSTGDLNNDGIPDAEQPAVATLAWINNGNFQNAITGNLGSVPTNSIISLLVQNAGGAVDPNTQIENIQVVPNASLPSALPDTVSTTWDPISFAVAPSGENAPIDSDPSRAGTQQKVLIDIANAGLDKGTFNHYMIYISADTINNYAAAGKPLIDLDGHALTTGAQAGWYDYTARTTGGDGVRYITENGKITGMEITTTDGTFGDASMVNGEFSYYGVPVNAATQTVRSDNNMTLANGIDNLMLNNISKTASSSAANCLPDWLAKMTGNANQAVKSVANLNGTGNSWDNEITGNNGNNKLLGLDGDDTLTGLKGNDLLVGGNGADKLFGGAGNDTFKFVAVTDSPAVSGQFDTIEDFQRGHDKIDLRSIDANSNKNGNQAFKLVSEFTNQAGQAHFDASTHMLQADVNGDGTADFAIEVIGVAKLTAADILL